jgi:hypothetical protein
MTEYKVFAQAGESDGWYPIGPDSVVARSAKGAIQEALSKRTDVDGYKAFVAVPARSFAPVTVKVETKTALRFS